MCRGLQLLFLGKKKKKKSGVSSGNNLLKCWKAEQIQEVLKRQIFIVASHQMTVKHLQEVDSVVNCPGASRFF